MNGELIYMFVCTQSMFYYIIQNKYVYLRSLNMYEQSYIIYV